MNPPLASEINALPARMRQYVHNLVSDADPAGDKMRLLIAEENNAALSARVVDLEQQVRDLQLENDDLECELNAWEDR